MFVRHPHAGEPDGEDDASLLGSLEDDDSSVGDGDAGGEGTGAGSDGTGADSAGAATPDWGAQIAELRTGQENLAIKITEQFSRLMTQLAPPSPAATKDPKAENDAWGLAQQVPGIMPQLVQREASNIAEALVTKRLKEMEDRLQLQSRRQNAEGRLDQIVERYRDDIEKGGPIVRATASQRAVVADLIAPELVNTPAHDKLALAVALATNPRVVAKREVARARAAEKARVDAASRSSALSVVGGGGGGRNEPVADKITDEDIALGQEMGIDLTNEKVAARFLAARKSEKLPAFGDTVRLG